jgi:hypothetical protein
VENQDSFTLRGNSRASASWGHFTATPKKDTAEAEAIERIKIPARFVRKVTYKGIFEQNHEKVKHSIYSM